MQLECDAFVAAAGGGGVVVEEDQTRRWWHTQEFHFKNTDQRMNEPTCFVVCESLVYNKLTNSEASIVVEISPRLMLAAIFNHHNHRVPPTRQSFPTNVLNMCFSGDSTKPNIRFIKFLPPSAPFVRLR